MTHEAGQKVNIAGLYKSTQGQWIYKLFCHEDFKEVSTQATVHKQLKSESYEVQVDGAVLDMPFFERELQPTS